MMAKSTYYVDKSDSTSIQAIIDAVDAGGTDYEEAILAALTLHDRSFVLNMDQVGLVQMTPLQDPFTFDMDTDELILYTDDPATLVDAIIEMAMYLRGFNTLIGVEDDWKTQLAIGAWRYVRDNLKGQLYLMPPSEKQWSASLEPETVEHFNLISFATVIFLAGCPNLDVVFPDGTSPLVEAAYHRLVRMLQTVAYNVGINDFRTFNRRLGRAVSWIEETLMPKDASPFDDLFEDSEDELDDQLFDEGPDGWV